MVTEIEIEEILIDKDIDIGTTELDIIKMFPELEDLEITPSGEEQNFKSEKYGYNNIKVKAVESEELNIIPSSTEQIKEGIYNKVVVAGDNDLIAENIKKGVEIFGIQGNAKTTNAKITDTSYLFYYGARTNCIEEILDLCENVTTTYYMFAYSEDLTKLDLSNLNTDNVKDMYGMFRDCKSLTELNLSNFNTENVTNMSNMFNNCQSLTELDLSNFNTDNVVNMNNMFYFCFNLTELNLSNFNTKNVIDMNNMFYNCKKINKLDLSSFNTENVVNMSSMFSRNERLSELNLSNFDMSKINSVSSFLSYCTNLTNLKSFKNLGKGYTQKSSNYSNYKLDLSRSTKLTYESLIDVITNGLYDLNLTYDVANGGTLYTQQLILGSTNIAKLTAEEIAIATNNKGWTVS